MSTCPFVCSQNQPPMTNPIYAQRADPPQGKFLPLSRERWHDRNIIMWTSPSLSPYCIVSKPELWHQLLTEGVVNLKTSYPSLVLWVCCLDFLKSPIKLTEFKISSVGTPQKKAKLLLGSSCTIYQWEGIRLDEPLWWRTRGDNIRELVLCHKNRVCAAFFFSISKNNLHTICLHISIKEGETIQAISFLNLSSLASWNRSFQVIEIVDERYSKHVNTCLYFSYSLQEENKN